MPMPGLQEMIYHLEVGAGTKLVKRVLLVLGLLVLTGYYDWREYKNFSTAEAMDVAQLARNLATGHGYTTQFIRPLSVYLVEQHRPDRNPFLKGNHPDLANAPVYPVLLATLMKVLPFQYDIPRGVPFLRYQPEMLIAFFNQALFFVAIGMVYRLAKRLFDETVAALALVTFAGSVLFWRFSVSGLSTLALVVIFLGLAGCLVRLEQAMREGNRSAGWLVRQALLAGLLVALGGLTRYSFGWLILPVAGFLAWVSGPRRTVVVPVTLAAFVLGMAPWVTRNFVVSGTPFGTAGYAIYADTTNLPGNTLERSFTADLKGEAGAPDASSVTGPIGARDWLRKLLVNANSIVQNDLPRLGGSWVCAFFLAGLLVPFLSPALARLRIFLLACLGVLLLVQALGRTQLSVDSPDINSENLLVLLAPLVFIYGVGMYSMLLDQVQLPFAELRRLVNAGFALVMCAPLGFALLPPRTIPLVYPPYYPPLIQQMSTWMQEKDLMMSDMPWAVAWYGRRSCIWLTLNPRRDFFAINDERQPVQALYLSQVTLDERLQTQLLGGKDREWGRFFLELLRNSEVPTGFPLRQAYRPLLPEGQVFLSDWQRWNRRD